MSVNVNKGEHWFRTLRVTVIIKDACVFWNSCCSHLKKFKPLVLILIINMTMAHGSLLGIFGKRKQPFTVQMRPDTFQELLIENDYFQFYFFVKSRFHQHTCAEVWTLLGLFAISTSLTCSFELVIVVVWGGKVPERQESCSGSGLMGMSCVPRRRRSVQLQGDVGCDIPYD